MRLTGNADSEVPQPLQAYIMFTIWAAADHEKHDAEENR